MNFTVTGEPAPSQLDQKRKTLLQSMLSSGPGAQKLLGGGRGLSRGYTANDSPTAAVPGLTFNPFLAQLQRGVSGLQAPTQQPRQVVNDLTGAPGAAPTFSGSGATPGAQAPQPGGAPTPDPGPQGVPTPGGAPAAPTDLAGMYAAAGLNPSNLGQGNIMGMFSYDPTQTPPPPVPTPIQFLRPGLGRN